MHSAKKVPTYMFYKSSFLSEYKNKQIYRLERMNNYLSILFFIHQLILNYYVAICFSYRCIDTINDDICQEKPNKYIYIN